MRLYVYQLLLFAVSVCNDGTKPTLETFVKAPIVCEVLAVS